MNGKYAKTVKLMNTIQLFGWIIAASSLIGWVWLLSNAGFIGATVNALPAFVMGLLLMAVSHIAGLLIDIAVAVRDEAKT